MLTLNINNSLPYFRCAFGVYVENGDKLVVAVHPYGSPVFGHPPKRECSGW